MINHHELNCKLKLVLVANQCSGLRRMASLSRERLGVQPQIATNGTLLARKASESLIEAGVGSFLVDF